MQAILRHCYINHVSIHVDHAYFLFCFCKPGCVISVTLTRAEVKIPVLETVLCSSEQLRKRVDSDSSRVLQK